MSDHDHDHPTPLLCLRCGTLCRGEDGFCHCCGTALRRSCPSCGAEQAHTVAWFCSACGRKLESDETQETGTET
jgi:predicted amidophosphoribosyltransferase